MAFCTKNKHGNHSAKIKRRIRKIKRRFAKIKRRFNHHKTPFYCLQNAVLLFTKRRFILSKLKALII